MKEYTGIAINYFKTVKADSEDKNKEGVFAELNILLDEPEWKMNNSGGLLPNRKITEIELKVDARTARIFAKNLLKVAEKLEELEK